MCGFVHSIRETVPVSVTGLVASNSAAKEWCADSEAAMTPARQATVITCFMATVVHLSRTQVDSFRGEQPAGVAPENQALLFGADRRLLHRCDGRRDRRHRSTVGAEENAIGAERLRRERDAARAAAALAGVEVDALQARERQRRAR